MKDNHLPFVYLNSLTQFSEQAAQGVYCAVKKHLSEGFAQYYMVFCSYQKDLPYAQPIVVKIPMGTVLAGEPEVQKDLDVASTLEKTKIFLKRNDHVVVEGAFHVPADAPDGVFKN
jgi:hypothetical protein